MTETVTIRNGIDVDQLLATIDAVNKDPAWGRSRSAHRVAGRAAPTTSARSAGSSTPAKRTSPGTGVPARRRRTAGLLGRNKGPNAVSCCCRPGFCYAVGYVANAAARGIELTAMEYELEGDLDVRPFLGLAGPRAGSPRSGRRAGVQSQRHEGATGRAVPVRSGHLTGARSLANPVPVTTTLEVR